MVGFEAHPDNCKHTQESVDNQTKCHAFIRDSPERWKIDLPTGNLYDANSKLKGPNLTLVKAPPFCNNQEWMMQLAIKHGQKGRAHMELHDPVIHCTAASDTQGTAELYIGRDGTPTSASNLHTPVNKVARKVTVSTTPISSLVHSHVDIFKIDAQGHEHHILLGAEELVKSHGVDYFILEFAPRMLEAAGFEGSKTLDLLHNWGCTSCLSYPMLREFFTASSVTPVTAPLDPPPPPP